VTYEILISEDINEKNTKFLSDYLAPEFLKDKNITLFQLQQTYYNPYGHNMLEAPNKNLCLKHARGDYVCITSADVLMNNSFYELLARTEEPQLSKNAFYRFLTYAVSVPDNPIETYDSEMIMKHCAHNTTSCCNERLRNPMGISDIASKSGDIMLMDRENWLKIKGFPECGIFYHTDYIVCLVVANNRIPMYGVLDPIKVYEIEQPPSRSAKNGRPNSEPEQWAFAQTFRDKLCCN